MRSMLLLLALLSGCASPAEDYIRADAATWAQFDRSTPAGVPWIDAAVDADPTLSPEHKDALHQLSTSRRARVSHAVAAIGSS